MATISGADHQPLSSTDREELTRLVNTVLLSEKSLTLYAIAPESAPNHPVVKEFESELDKLEEPLQFTNFFYSDDSLFNCLATLDKHLPPDAGRRVIFAFGLEQLPKPRLKQALEQLNLARERIFEQNLILIFWLNRVDFLDEFRNRAPDFWDWRGKVATFETRHPLIYPYLEWLITENSYLTMSGVMQVNRQVDIFLDQVYVSLKAERRLQITTASKHQQTSSIKTASPRKASPSSSSLGEDVKPDFASEPMLEVEQTVTEVGTSATKTVTETVDLADVVRGAHSCNVILGAPGAGKTTLLKYLTLHFAKALRDGQETVQGGLEHETLGQPRWPVYFKIADYAERLEKDADLELLEYLKRFYQTREDYFNEDDATELSNLLLEQMHMGNCLILLDGLDEVFDQESRQQIVRKINDFAEQFGHNKLIVTSRIAGYHEVKLASRFTEFTIADMSDVQASEFLHRWCRAVEQAQKPEATAEQHEREGAQQAEQILIDIQRNEGVRRLTANPLLLTILALIHRNGERLPERRVKLYELAVQTLTADWQLSKKLPNMQKVLLPEGEVVELLAPLAYWMHEEKPSGMVTHAEVVEQLSPRLADLRGEEPDSPEILAAVEEFLRRVRETTGLFVERAPDVYGFMHLTFEEYFAARDIADKDPDEILASIQQHWHEPRWLEPILLALGYYGSHSPRQVNRLFDRLFESLESYQPLIHRDSIKLLGGESPDAQIQWIRGDNSDEVHELPLKKLLFAGQVIAQVAEINANRRKKLIDQLLTTGLGLTADSSNAAKSVCKQIRQLLRQIEQFHQQEEVFETLQKFAQDKALSKESHLAVQAAKLYVVCGGAEASLVNCITELVENIEPELFCTLIDLIDELGAEMSPDLEMASQQPRNAKEQCSFEFVMAMSYVREEHYDRAIELFEKLSVAEDSLLRPYIAWALADCYQKKEKYDKANDFYQDCFERLADCIEPNAFWVYWRNRGVCQRLHRKYEEALHCFQKMLTIVQDLQNHQEEASALYHLGKTYQAWGKYEEAIRYHQQSREQYQQLGKETDVANLWYWIGICYREWRQYEQALEAQHQDLAICQKLDDQPGVALAYFQLGRIYQAWGKYEEAIHYHQQSREQYQLLGKETNVANQWYWIGDCYREWGRYEQALEAQHQTLAICQKLDDQPRVALAYLQLGQTYQAWGKYEEAIRYYQQSREQYQQLGKETNVANQWYWIGVCYREWGRYEQALEAQHQDLAICQKLDDQPGVALAYFQLGRIYQAWGKYEEAIRYHQQSREQYQQLGKETNVANQWYWIGDCYREWGQYEQALEAQHQTLAIRQKLDNRPGVALAYLQLGRIYQAWGKYEEAIRYHQQSREQYQQLGKETNVADLWYWIGDCYREWGQYEQALEAQHQDLAICQKLDDQPGVALAYFQLGRIYQAWGKYEEAIHYHQQSREQYQLLGKETNVANQWYWIGDCYREWGRYEQALEAQHQTLAICQKLDDQPRVALAYLQLGQTYQAWGKYEEAIRYYQQSREQYQQLGKETNVANQWYWIGVCYRDWGRYEQALEAAHEDLTIRQRLNDGPNIADAYFQLGRTYQAWGKYEEALNYHEQSRSLYEKLDLQQRVANQLFWLAACYRDLEDYSKAVEYYQKSLEKHQNTGHIESITRRLRQMANTQRLQAKSSGHEEAVPLLQQAESNLQKAIQLDEAKDYRENLAYDQIAFALLVAEQLQRLPLEDSAVSEHITQFEQAVEDGFSRLSELGQTVDRADEALDIARAYLETGPLENLDKAENLARQSLQTFQEFDRRKLQASANKLLGDIFLARANRQEPNAMEAAAEFLTASLQLYRELDITKKALEIESLLSSHGIKCSEI